MVRLAQYPSKIEWMRHRHETKKQENTLADTVSQTLKLKVLNFWKFTSYCSLKPLWSGMGEVVPAHTSPTLHPPSPSIVHQLSWLALWELIMLHVSCTADCGAPPEANYSTVSYNSTFGGATASYTCGLQNASFSTFTIPGFSATCDQNTAQWIMNGTCLREFTCAPHVCHSSLTFEC